jgi:hypothetical protein
MRLIQLNDSHDTFLSTDEGDSERSSSTYPVVAASSSNSTAEKKLPKWTSWMVRYQGTDKRRVFPSRRRSFRNNYGRNSSKLLSPRALEVLESHQDGDNDEPRFVPLGTESKKYTATLDADINEEDDVRSNSSISVEPDSSLELSAVLPNILNAASLSLFEQCESVERNSEHLFVIQEEDATSDDFASGCLPEASALHSVSVFAPSIPVDFTKPAEKSSLLM